MNKKEDIYIMPYANFDNNTKICSNKSCEFVGQHQPIKNFTSDISRKDKLEKYCKKCKTILEKKRNRNPEKKKRKKFLDSQRYLKNKIEYTNSTEYKLKLETKKAKEINRKIARNIRARLKSALKGNYKTGSAVRDLGCSIEYLKTYIESLFYVNADTGQYMFWDNYGLKGWHIDHIIPLVNFDLSNRREFLRAVHYSNLQPLWAKENLDKRFIKK